MAGANEYHFITRWRAEGTADEVYDLIRDPLDLPRWWPSVYLRVVEISPGDEQGIGRRVHMHTKGWLPYTLDWDSCSTEATRPRRLALRASGDFKGQGIWNFEQDGRFVNITFDWQLTADKPMLRHLSLLLKPVFSANHRWAMAQGEKSLKLELQRRRVKNFQERQRVPGPPGPNRTSVWWLALGAVAVIGAGVWIARMLK